MNENERADWEFKLLKKRIIKVLFFAGLFGFVIFGISWFFGSYNEASNTLQNEKLMLVAEELNVDTKDIIIEEKFLQSYYTVFTPEGEYKVQFDLSGDETSLKSAIKVVDKQK